jgi:cellulose synthase/poly-beta-1,6-N-acetylglucosamine synthase-like glycosyltransferase
MSSLHTGKIRISGKFLADGNRKFLVKGVTYGTFAPREGDVQFPEPEMVKKDFRLMAENGINSVRTYTIPPLYLLDIARDHGLKVMVGLPWAQHITFLDHEADMKAIIEQVEKGVASCQNHTAVLCYSIGNEIPAPIVRWYGKSRIERFLHQLYRAAKSADPHGLVTYVNYPTTEYLDLPFLDFYCFNVYLETKEKLQNYLLRLQNLSGEKPLVLAEIGLDSRRNGLEKQADVLEWQIQTLFEGGCAGTFLFAWTDEWWRGGYAIEDWDFGLVDRNRQPKPALQRISAAFKKNIPEIHESSPFISVVVCTYNGSATIRDTMEGLKRLDYELFEVIVVNDGSKDETASIVAEYPYRLINQQNKGLSEARNAGIYAASGEIVAFIDDDAYPDTQWLRYLAHAFRTTNHAGIGGPNIAPGDDGPVANCVALAPGGPVHVLLTDEIAEHIPGCNMAFRRDVLIEIGGFDPIYRSAGDDVDLCWRIQHTGRTIGYHPAAFVWHHRRNSVKAYWKQQKGYGKAEALLENKWPEKYNGFGHLSWVGRIYGNGLTLPIQFKREKVFHGTWGSALFQSVYQRTPHLAACLPLMPEWYLLIMLLGFLSVLGILWAPLLAAIPFFIISLILVLAQAGISAFAATRYSILVPAGQRWKYWLMTTYLHTIQPIARLNGRIRYGLTPWRKRGTRTIKRSLRIPQRKLQTHWSEEWKSTETWLEQVEANLLKAKARVRRGGVHDRWDLSTCCGFFTSARSILTIEEHGGGKQLLRFRTWAYLSAAGIVALLVLGTIGLAALLDQSYTVAGILGFLILLFTAGSIADTTSAMNDLTAAFANLDEKQDLSASKFVTRYSVIEKAAQEEAVTEPLLREFGQQILPLKSNTEARISSR